MKTASLAQVKDQLSGFLRKAAHEDIVITKHGKPAGVLIGFETEDDWFEYRLLHDPRFLKRVAQARAGLRAGKGIPWEDIQKEEDRRKSEKVS
ncbi:MAG: type II toxin-antitoxin system Phd/YefM family antitoxin [Candidatus Brocadiia bacterium]|jgi:prevent-host-death family protein